MLGGESGESNKTESWNGSSLDKSCKFKYCKRDTLQELEQANTNGLASEEVTLTKQNLWNGSSWTEVADLNQSRNQLSGTGTATSALAFGGYTREPNLNTESWNGSSWTEVNNLNTGPKF